MIRNKTIDYMDFILFNIIAHRRLQVLERRSYHWYQITECHNLKLYFSNDLLTIRYKLQYWNISNSLFLFDNLSLIYG